MAATTTLTAQPAIVRLGWESNHFGLSAAQLTTADLGDEALAAALRLARGQGVRLLVWPTEQCREVPPELLGEFDGALVDRKATFSRPLQEKSAEGDALRAGEPAVIPYAEAVVSPALFELAISAGVYSRFRVDPHFPSEKFAAMYRLWIERSVSRELADVVLVVPQGDRGGTAESLAGMITLAEADGVASISLVAVAAEARGRGIGSALMRAAHRWMRARRAHEARVVTQLANLPACRLYERSAYRPQRVQNYYHFWL